MKECLKFNGYDLYTVGDSPKELADKVLNRHFNRAIEVADLPIDPFCLLRDSGVIYSFLDFDKFEGFYLLPKNLSNPKEKTMVGINKNRPIARQRFTAAHELAHHIKDEQTIYCMLSDNGSEVEKYANEFASNLLMPQYLLNELIQTHSINKEMSQVQFLKSVLKISVLFGVSFQSTLYRVNNIIRKIEYKNLKKEYRKFKPDAKKKELGIDNDYILYSQVVKSYAFSEWNPTTKVKNDFIRLLISNDHRMENGTLEVEEISELIAEIRYCGLDNVQKSRKNAGLELVDADFEVLGQWEMYNRVFSDYSLTSICEILLLHKNFYKYAPYPEVGGAFRTASARIAGKQVSTERPENISSKINYILNDFDTKRKNQYFTDKYLILDYLIKLHHEITVIHPFYDGNGRTSRALLNKQLLLFGIPAFYIETEKKKGYEKGLEECDTNQNYESLFIFIVKSIIEVYDKII
ncbi:Fic family protein [Enterococcus faecalis]|nr:Fic family protein [Enterococcus faecalis]